MDDRDEESNDAFLRLDPPKMQQSTKKLFCTTTSLRSCELKTSPKPIRISTWTFLPASQSIWKSMSGEVPNKFGRGLSFWYVHLYNVGSTANILHFEYVRFATKVSCVYLPTTPTILAVWRRTLIWVNSPPPRAILSKMTHKGICARSMVLLRITLFFTPFFYPALGFFHPLPASQLTSSNYCQLQNRLSSSRVVCARQRQLRSASLSDGTSVGACSFSGISLSRERSVRWSRLRMSSSIAPPVKPVRAATIACESNEVAIFYPAGHSVQNRKLT